MRKLLVLLSFVVFTGSSGAYTREELLLATVLVESSFGKQTYGDDGRSLGPLQVGRAAWQDSGVEAPYSPYDMDLCIQVWVAYCTRYAGAHGSNEAWARVWNGGPRGQEKSATDVYWLKILSSMKGE